MKFLLYGEADEMGSGAWCYRQTLIEMGHEVPFFHPFTKLPYHHSLSRRIYRNLTKTFWEPDRRAHLDAFFQLLRAEQPDAIIILKGINFARADVEAMRQTGVWVVNINHDDFFSAYPLNWSRLQRAALPAYDYILTTREVNVAEVRPSNPRVEFFPFAYDPHIHRPVTIPTDERARWETDVVFVGAWAQQRCELLETLVQRVPARYSIHGPGWGRLRPQSPLKPFLQSTGVYGDDMAKAVIGAEISLGFLRKENRDDYTQRSFEIPACGGLLLAERTARHQAFFREGVEAEFFNPDSPDELCQKVAALLADEAKRNAMREEGRHAVLRQKHTYRDRLERLLQLYAEHERAKS